jgi:hypothetical protein
MICNVIWYVIYDVTCDIMWCDIWYNMIYYIMIWYINLQLGWHPVRVVQYTFTHKQYIEQYNRPKQYTEQHNSLIWKSADRTPFLRVIRWHLPYNWGKTLKNLVSLLHQSQRQGILNLVNLTKGNNADVTFISVNFCKLQTNCKHHLKFCILMMKTYLNIYQFWWFSGD